MHGPVPVLHALRGCPWHTQGVARPSLESSPCPGAGRSSRRRRAQPCRRPAQAHRWGQGCWGEPFEHPTSPGKGHEGRRAMQNVILWRHRQEGGGLWREHKLAGAVHVEAQVAPPTVARGGLPRPHRHAVGGVAMVGGDLQAAGGILLVVDVQLQGGQARAGVRGANGELASLPGLSAVDAGQSSSRAFRSGRRADQAAFAGLQGRLRGPRAWRAAVFRHEIMQGGCSRLHRRQRCAAPAQCRSAPTNVVPARGRPVHAPRAGRRRTAWLRRW